MKLKLFLHKTLGLKPEESMKFSLLFFHSFFLGLFIAFYFVPANSVFIQHIGSERLPIAYIAAGLAGYLITSFYSSLQKKVHSRTLFLSALVFMLIVPAVARVGLAYTGTGGIVYIPFLSELGLNFTLEGWLSFFVFIWGWPFISLVAIESGGIALRFFHLQQVKRLFGLVNMGGVIASIVGYLAIPLLLTFLNHPYDLLYIGQGGIIVSIVLLLFVYKMFGHENKSKEKHSDESGSKTSIFSLMREKYFGFIFISATLSMIVIYFADFGFLASIKEQDELISTPEQLSNFLAVVFGGLKIGELIMSYFSGRILSRYGVKLGLTILPVTITLLMLGATISAFTLGVSSLLFFSFMVLNKSFERILRRSLDDPSFNILYQLLPDSQKLSVQTKVGVIMQLAIGIAGLGLLIITQLLGDGLEFDLKYFSAIFLPLALIWAVVAMRLYRQYKEKLREILAERNRKKERLVHKDIYGSDVLANQLKTKNIEFIRLSANILAETNPKILEPFADSLLHKKDDIIKKVILRNIDPTWPQNLKPVIGEIAETEENDEVKQLAVVALENLNFDSIAEIKNTDIERLKKSDKNTDKLKLIKWLNTKETKENTDVILALLDDSDKLVKQAAIQLAANDRSPVLISKLMRLLKAPDYQHIVGSTLVEMGDVIAGELDKLFNSDASGHLLIKICEICGRIGTLKTQSILVNHINYPDREVQDAVIRALYYSHFQASAEQQHVVKKKIEETVGNILWIFLTISDVEAEKNTLKLVQALDLERETNFEKLFSLLSFIYQPATIDLIKTNIIGENIIFALEIIDNFVSQDVKQLIVPIIDKISINQRMKKLDPFFSMKKMKFTDRLKEIIMVDFNRIDLWTKNKSIELLGKLYKRKRSREVSANQDKHFTDIEIWTKERALEILSTIRRSEIPDEIFLCLHHPDELVYSTAAKIIYDENPASCISHLEKLSEPKQRLIDILSNDTSDLLLERVKLLKRIPLFFRLPENTIVKLGKIFKTRPLSKNAHIELVNEDISENIVIVLKGKLEYSKAKESKSAKFTNRDIIVRGINIDQNAEQIVASRKSTVLAGKRFEYFNLLVEETEIIQYMFETKNQRR